MKHLPTILVLAALAGAFAWVAWPRKPAAPAPTDPRTARGGTTVFREREPEPGECANTLVRITLAPGVAEEVKLELYEPKLDRVADTIRANAESLYPPSQYARVAPRLPGVVREVKAILGQDVQEGEVLAVLDSPDFGALKQDLLQALSTLKLRQETYDQEKQFFDKKITSGRELLQATTQLEEAKLALAQARQKLASLGITSDPADTSGVLEVTAPFAGRVVEASAVRGETASTERSLFSVAAVERLWISIDVYESDLAKVEKDQKVAFTVEGLPSKKFPGRIVAIGGEVDDRTRTVRVFAEVKNVQGLLRANMFGRAEITVKPPEPKLLVPREAVQNDGDCWLVFVSPARNVYQARKVEIGAVYQGGYEIVGGLAAGEKVVTTGSFLLKTEVLRGQMGAG